MQKSTSFCKKKCGGIKNKLKKKKNLYLGDVFYLTRVDNRSVIMIFFWFPFIFLNQKELYNDSLI